MELPTTYFVLGGAASGKSAFAEALVVQTGRPRHYIATARDHGDREMQHKIKRHRATRGAGWHTIEAPLDLTAPLRSVPEDAAVLLDCATLWLTNHLLADADLDAQTDRLIEACAACPAHLTVVSNEVGQGIVPDNALSRRFRAAQGQLNQRLAAWAGNVALVTAGLPQWLKGGP